MSGAGGRPATDAVPADYRRLIDVVPSPGRVVAEMQDYVHHFRVVIDHADGIVTRAEGSGVRVPWTTCPLGAAGVAVLAGTPVPPPAAPDSWVQDRTGQCTHMIDLASVAISHVDEAPLRYDIVVSPSSGQRRRAVLRRDGHVALEWHLDGDVIASPGVWQGMALRGPELRAWVQTSTDGPLREQVAVLRRACHIAPSRTIAMDDYVVAAEISILDSSCHTLQPGVAQLARRVRGTTRATETYD